MTKRVPTNNLVFLTKQLVLCMLYFFRCVLTYTMYTILCVLRRSVARRHPIKPSTGIAGVKTGSKSPSWWGSSCHSTKRQICAWNELVNRKKELREKKKFTAFLGRPSNLATNQHP